MAAEKALRLTLGNAPATWHMVADLPGLYHPELPTPVGEFISKGAADAAHADSGVPVEFVKADAQELEATAVEIREVLAEQVKAARSQDVTPEQRDAAIGAVVTDDNSEV